MERCLGCMELIDDQVEVCPLCGYFKGSGVQEAYYLEPGTVLKGQYLLGKVLGYGGFGVTYIGYDNKLQRKIAVKEYLPSDYATRKPGTKEPVIYSGDAREQFMAGLSSFLEEARNLAGFSGIPEIVDIYDCFQENGTGYIVMEYLKGKTVKELLAREGRFPYQKAEEIILHVLDGLEAVHKEGIIHRDIAPDNIFITDEGEIKLLDFGAARYAASIYSRSLSVILKPGYAPEEQYRSHGQQGAWTDIYGVGATFYRMITGERPPESLERMVEDDLKRPSELGVEIPPEKEEILMKSLKVQMEDRIQSAEEFKGALTKVPNKPQKEDKKEKDKKEKEQIKKEQKKEDGGNSGGAGGPEKPAGGRLFVKLGIACCVVGICVVGFYFGRDIIGGNGSAEQSESIAQSESESKAESERLQSEEESKAESERLQSEEELKAESERLQSEEESKAESERLQSEEESKAESERQQSEEESKAESEHLQSEEESKAESERQQSEEESKAESERLQSEEESKAESERQQSEEESKAESERLQSEEESKAESERLQSEKESEAESTAQSERESEAKRKKEKKTTYQLLISTEGEQQKIKLHDKTGLSGSEITIVKRSEGAESTVYSTKGAENQGIAEADANGLYNLKVTGGPTEAPLVYYNLNLAEMKEVWLEQKDGYAYISYKTKDSEEKVTQDKYRCMTYESARTRYILADSLTIREAPDNNNGAALSACSLGQEVKVCGLAKGLIEGNEGDWYILELNSGYGFISAKDDYSTDDKSVADAEVERAEQEKAAEEQVNNWVPTPAPSPSPNWYTGGGNSGGGNSGGGNSGGGQIHIVDGGDL